MFSSNTTQVSDDANFIESCFSTYLYTGNGSTQTITNGIDLAGEGGLVWLKNRSGGASGNSDHALYDTIRGGSQSLTTNSTSGNQNYAVINSFNSNGFTLANTAFYDVARVGANNASWTFRKQPKFFEVVTWTGNGANRTIAHNLGSVPGCIIVKRTDTTGNWQVYHRSLASAAFSIQLNLTNAQASTPTVWNSTTPTASVFSLGTDATVNASGGTYVAYLFAHDAGGFGLTGTDNVISCGSYTGNGSATGPVVTLGYEPQWLMVKNASGTGNWQMIDNMRGMPVGSADATLQANLSNAESSTDYVSPTATGFQVTSTSIEVNTNASVYVYVAIRRGPMKVPTTGTSVFNVQSLGNSTSAAKGVNLSEPSDFVMSRYGRSVTGNTSVATRLTGYGVQQYNLSTTNTPGLITNSTAAEAPNRFIGVDENFITTWLASSADGGMASYFMRRAPGFFDEICFSGSGANTTQAHNLQKAPELWLVKSRSASTQWVFGSSLLGANEKIVMPSPNGRVTDTTVWNNTYPTASVLSLGTSSTTNASGATFVAYLWGTVSGVSKVGTYTGNGSSQTIDCGFAGGARFVMIIRATASTAQDIYIWDTARGIVSGNDPRLSLNTTAAEVTTLDTIDTASSGFVVNTDASNVNVNGAVYLYLSIA